MNAENTFTELRIKRLKNYISRMPSLSTTATKVLQICNSPTTSPNDLNRVISLDPVLTANILRLINSAYYALPNQVASLTRAIIMIGINTVKNLVLSTAVLKKLGSSDGNQTMDMDEFWTHSLCVGVTAKLLSASLGVPIEEREEYFVAGLLHDLGKIPLNNRFPEEYTEVLDLVKANRIPLYEAENEGVDVNHCQVGKLIAEKWKLGNAMHDSIVYHHNPEESSDSNFQLVSAVALANNYANETGIGAAGDIFWDKDLTTALITKFNINWSNLLEMHESILNEIVKAKIFLKISE